MDDYRDSKSLLFTSHLNKNGTAVICVNNDEWEFFCEQAQGKSRNIIGVGHKNKEQDFFKKCGNNWSDIYFLSLTPKESTLKGISGTLALAGKKNLISKADFCSPLLGDFQFENILCAVGATLASGFTLNQITPILSELKNIPGRLEKVLLPPHLSAAPIILVDYSHTPDSLEKALHTCKKALTTAGKGKLLCVFGCGGDRDRTKRPIMGKIASEICDLVVITSDNPRTEDPDAIIDEIFTGISKQNCLREQDRKKAIEVAIRCANSDDLIIIAGKGHEDYQIIGATKFPFSDAKVARLILLDAIQ